MESEAVYGPVAIVSPPGHIDPMWADFAKAALQGLLANSDWVQMKMQISIDECGRDDIDAITARFKQELAEDAVGIADSVVAQLIKDSEP